MFSLDNLLLMAAFVVVFVGQTVLCFTVRRLWIRLVPTVLFFVAALGFLAASPFVEGWTAVGCILLALLGAGFGATCGLGWGIWWMIKIIFRCKNKK